MFVPLIINLFGKKPTLNCSLMVFHALGHTTIWWNGFIYLFFIIFGYNFSIGCFSEPLLGGKCCAKHIPCIISFNLCS